MWVAAFHLLSNETMQETNNQQTLRPIRAPIYSLISKEKSVIKGANMYSDRFHIVQELPKN